MRTANKMLVEVINAQVISLLQDMERMNLIRLSSYDDGLEKKASHSAVESAEPLSRRFAGALRLSDERYNEFQASIKKGREEWTRAL
jgi:hypothetical protein